MERINRPNDNLREILSRSHIEQICNQHSLPQPQEIIPEGRGNEKVIYYLDHRFVLAFCWSPRILQIDIESLAVLERIEAMPTPRVIAQMEECPELQVPYIIMEQCPGIRLDALWDKTSHTQRLKILEALGAGMGRYHTVGAEEAIRLAAIDFDAWSIVELSKSIEEPHVPGWLKGWVEKHFYCLQGWLSLSKRVDRAMFRWEIGPY